MAAVLLQITAYPRVTRHGSFWGASAVTSHSIDPSRPLSPSTRWNGVQPRHFMSFLRRPALFAASYLAATIAAAAIPNPVVFVTQMPIALEVNSRTASQSRTSVASAFANHLGDTASAGRGGALWIIYPGATTPRNLTLAGGYGGAAKPFIAVRQPHVHWDGTKALFSMVVGAPATAADTTTFFWQIYEITNFGSVQTPVITLIPNQPANANNVSPCYGTDGRIIFTSDRTRDNDGLSPLYPQREEYLLLPTNTGLWSLDRTDPTGLILLEHSPSGSFTPFVDSSGRVIFTRWDHLSRDPQATTDRPPGTGDTYTQTFNGTFNYSDESAGATILNSRLETFPEPRSFDVSGRAGTNLNGNSFNQFTPWMINEDGSNHETINHVGRHEFYNGLSVSYTNDPNLVPLNKTGPQTSASNIFQTREDPRLAHAGEFYAINAADVGYHAAGQIVKYLGGPSTNPASMVITPVTALQIPPPSPQPPLATAVSIYRQALPLSDGSLLAVETPARTTDGGPLGGGATEAYLFRIRTVAGSLGNMTAGANLFTTPLTANLTFFVNGAPFTYNGQMWEFDPVEVVVRTKPGGTTAGASVSGLESIVFGEELVDIPTFQKYLTTNDLALIISRNVTTRDAADRQQPFQLKINSPTSTTQTLASGITPAGKIYGISHLQILQADQLRGFTNNTANPVPGRRILAVPMHDVRALADMPVSGSPAPGSVKLGDDGSLAALLPARRAVTWQLIDTDGTSQIKERYWLSLKPGEIRTCTSCHGINQLDQASQTTPTNKPQALRDFLRFWKTQYPPGVLQHVSSSVSSPKSTVPIQLSVTRTAGSTGPVTLNWQTANGTAIAGQDFTAASGVLTWTDGDSAAKPINLTSMNNPLIGASKTFTVTLSGPTQGATIGGSASASITLTETPVDAWRFANFGSNANTSTIAGDNADPDADGLANLLEYVLGANPNGPSASSQPVNGLTAVSGQTYVTLTFTRDTTVPDATCLVQQSPNLQAWNDGSSYNASTTVASNAFTVQVSRVPAGAGRETITVRDVNPTSGGDSFLRLKATRP